MILAPTPNSQTRHPGTRRPSGEEQGPGAVGRIGRPDPVYAGRGR
jgi:hypothetical protein